MHAVEGHILLIEILVHKSLEAVPAYASFISINCRI